MKYTNAGLCIYLQHASLCPDCDNIYDNRLFSSCPNCGSAAGHTITLWIKKMPLIQNPVVSVNAVPVSPLSRGDQGGLL